MSSKRWLKVIVSVGYGYLFGRLSSEFGLTATQMFTLLGMSFGWLLLWMWLNQDA
jgi:hypothetical protein